jgi:hypothetical protein
MFSDRRSPSTKTNDRGCEEKKNEEIDFQPGRRNHPDMSTNEIQKTRERHPNQHSAHDRSRSLFELRKKRHTPQTMPNRDALQKLCYTETNHLKPKPECRAAMINTLILDEMMDIDEAEDYCDKLLRELNLWNEPTLEKLLRDDPEEANTTNTP